MQHFTVSVLIVKCYYFSGHSMASTLSVSKGVFVFKNGAKAATKKCRKKNKSSENLFSDSLWYRSYKTVWNTIETKIQDLNHQMFTTVLANLINYIRESYKNSITEIPTVALLTGINMPDHAEQFKTLTREIKRCISPHVAVLKSEDCSNLKYLVEHLVNQLMVDEQDLLEDESDTETKRVKKSQCSFALLQSWYEDLYMTTHLNASPKKQKTKTNKKIIVVVIPDFESFPPKVIQDFILIASSYINILPFVFVFGVATALAVVHRSLPYHVSSKIKIQVFHSSPSILHLNNILENILFSPECPFHLGGKVFNLFTDIFLFYDLSVSGFVQNFKYAMLEHFSYGNAMALCTNYDILSEFTHEDYENVRHLLSFRKFVENDPPECRIQLLNNDEYFRKRLRKQIKKLNRYKANFHLFLKCLHVLVCDLPRAPLGKQVRELYSLAVSKNITSSQEYKECFQLLSFQSKDELINKILKIINVLENNCGDLKTNYEQIQGLIYKLNRVIYKLNNLEIHVVDDDDLEIEMECEEIATKQLDRQQLKQKLLSMSKQIKPMNRYEKVRLQILNYLSSQFEYYLVEPSNFYFHEIFFFNDMSIQNRIIGSHRAAIHTALNDPNVYLQCSCCGISNDSIILPSMPDISIIYKLHLECGKMINLYDWLQAFLSIVDPQETTEDDLNPKVSPLLQARFTQAVAELEYLGFIKSSKRKTDHVARLTWGG